MSTAPPPLPADLTAGLKRLKLAAMRNLAPELLVTAKTQRWKPEEFLRTLVEAEIAAREASNARTRMRAATFPVTKSLAEFDLSVSSVPASTFDYLSSLEWIRATENLCLIGPAGTGKSHCETREHAFKPWALPAGPVIRPRLTFTRHSAVGGCERLIRSCRRRGRPDRLVARHAQR